MLVTFLAIFGIVSFPASAQMNVEDRKEMIVDSVEVNRKAIIAINLNFTEEESKAFWPQYNLYRNAVKIVNDKLIKAIQKYADNYETLTDTMAAELMQEAMSIEEDRMILKQVYVADLEEILPMKKVVILYQIENKLNAVLRAELAAMIPLVSESAQATSVE